MSAPLWAAFQAASDRFPAKLFWRTTYDFIAERQPEAFTLMNYGYAQSSEDDARGESLPRQMYRYVASGAGTIDLEGKSLLEVGSGRGGGLAHVKQTLKPRTAFGVDLSPRAVALARKRHGSVPGLSFFAGDAEALPFGDGTFDAVLNVESSHCYPDIGRFYREVHRVLVPGGHFLYTDFFFAPEADEAHAAMADAGFTIVAEEDISENVLTALRLDEPRKLPLIAKMPSFLHEPFHNFAATTRSENYQLLESRQRRYLRFVLRRS
ncbi:MAG: class I SAM-dependent methyltransferase [Byssovorax sp.]